MDTAAAAYAKVVATLDAEIAKRQSRKDKAEDERWEREFGGDDVILLAKPVAPLG